MILENSLRGRGLTSSTWVTTTRRPRRSTAIRCRGLPVRKNNQTETASADAVDQLIDCRERAHDAQTTSAYGDPDGNPRSRSASTAPAKDVVLSTSSPTALTADAKCDDSGREDQGWALMDETTTSAPMTAARYTCGLRRPIFERRWQGTRSGRGGRQGWASRRRLRRGVLSAEVRTRRASRLERTRRTLKGTGQVRASGEPGVADRRSG